MNRWFLAQPIHRKLIVTSMAKTTAVLSAAIVTLLVLDGWRLQRNAATAASTLAAMVAENVRGPLASRDAAAAAAAAVDTARFQPSVGRVCTYGADGALSSQYVGSSSSRCPVSLTASGRPPALGAIATVEREGLTVGRVFVELTWTSWWGEWLKAVAASLVVLILATGVMFVLSDRLHRRISRPIGQLAAAAQRIGQTDYQFPAIEAGQDEVGDLVKAFGGMVDRVRTANLDLTRTNEALRREIEERRVIEAEREALLDREREVNRVKDEFLATVSHELRTPLNAIVGWARILTTAAPDPGTVAKAAASLHRNALAQARVIDDLIDISRIVTGKLTVLAEPVDLRAVVETGVEAIRPAAVHAGVVLTVDLPEDPCVITGDRDRLQQVVFNLLSNAVKFAPRGAVSVSLTPQGSSLTLVVADTGIGIAPDFLAHVFDRFRQADASTTREHGGLGIGMAIAKQLVELHGGVIRAESRGLGQGARFSVTLPWVAGRQPAQPAQEGAPSLEGVSVLAVDDNLDALEILDAVLSRAGARVRLAASGAEALKMWEREPPDVLLCDLAMPRMSGFELLGRIRDLDGLAGRVTPVIAVTAHATEEQVARSARAGFQMHIAKPFDTNRLIQAVNRVRTLV